MFLVTGITGKVGGATADHLLQAGKQVRALVRDEAKAAVWKTKGVELVKGEWEDTGAMTKALAEVEGAYLMMPPLQTPSRDFREAKGVIASYKEALRNSAPPKVVALSSIGSEKPSGLGLITSTHLLEEGLRDQPFPVAFVRAASFYENYLYGFQTGKGGTLPTFYLPTERPIPMIATQDIGAEIAKLLLSNWTGERVIELGSLDSPDKVAGALSQVLGREVRAQGIPREGWTVALQHMGMPEGGTWAFEEMCEGVNSGWIAFGADGAEKVAGITTALQVFTAANQ